MKPENVDFLNQLANALEKAEINLEEAYRKGNSNQFNKVKKFILQIQEKILEGLE